jgi:hypothetical protein
MPVISWLVVAAPELASASILSGLDCQTALRGSFGPQRLFGELSNHSASFEPCPPTAYRRHSAGAG